MEGSKLFYRTRSVCPSCSIIDRKGFSQIPARVECLRGSVWLTAECPEHGIIQTLYCKDIKFFENTLKFLAPTDSLDLNVEDLPRILRGEGRGANRPLSFSLRLWDRSNGFMEENQIIDHLTSFREQMQNREDLTFILSVKGKLCTDMELLNSKVEFITTQHKGPIVLECTYDRLILISRLPNSIFHCPFVYPAVKFHVKSSQENMCLEEMEKLQRNLLLEFSEMAALCTLVLERTDFAYPNLSAIMNFVRASPRFWRYVVVSAERELDVLESITRDVMKDRPVVNSVDPCTILDLLSDQANLKRADFIPASAALMLEPLLYMLHYGKFSLKISPFCGFVNVLVNEPPFVSRPLHTLIDMPKMYTKLIPLLPRIRANKYEISIPLANTLRKIFKSCRQPGVKNFDVVGKVMRDGAEAGVSIMKNMQFIIVHNTMDIGSVDILRRCSCAVTERNSNSEIVSSCTGCI